MRFQNKFRVVIFSLWRFIIKRREKKECFALSKNILIIQAGAIGDGIMALGTLRRLIEIFNSKTGYQTTLLCEERCKDMFCHNIDNNVNVISLKAVNNYPCIRDFKELARKLDDICYETCIVLFSASWGDYFTLCVKADTRIAALWRRKYGKNRIPNLIFNRTYDIFMDREIGEFIPNSGEKVMHFLGDKDYKAQKQLLYDNYGSEAKMDGEYVIVAPQSSVLHRCLPSEQLMNILKYILKNTKATILLTGMNKEFPYFEKIIHRLHDTRLVNYAGKTSLEMFVSLVRGAKLLIGADSGQVHIAAALNVPCICMTGYWQVGEFLPYHFADSTDNENIISVSCSQMYCANCYTVLHKAGKGNKECLKKIREGHSALCLEKINMADIYKAIDQFMCTENSLRKAK